MKPIVPVWLFSAAAAPTRNEPCSSANTSDATLGASTTESMIVKLTSGLRRPTVASESLNRKPLPLHETGAAVDETLEALGAVPVAGRASTPRT